MEVRRMMEVIIDGVIYVPKEQPQQSWVDHKTGLEWQHWEVSFLTWKEALNYAKSLGNDWRVPAIEELETLLDRSKYAPAMREEVPFKDVSHYWSSTTYARYTDHAWFVSFNTGHVNYNGKSVSYYVRCVRDFQIKRKDE